MTLSLVPELFNQLRVDIDESVAPGTVASVKFRDQIFMEVSAVERLAVTSVNGSTSIPIEVERVPAGGITLSVGYSHDDYESTIDDYTLGDDAQGYLEMVGNNQVRLTVASTVEAGAVIEVYAIGTLIARVTVTDTLKAFPLESSLASLPFTWRTDYIDNFGTDYHHSALYVKGVRGDVIMMTGYNNNGKMRFAADAQLPANYLRLDAVDDGFLVSTDPEALSLSGRVTLVRLVRDDKTYNFVSYS